MQSESEIQSAPQSQPTSPQTSQPNLLDLNSPYMRRVMKESAYQLADKVMKFLEHSELTYQAYKNDRFTPPRSQPPIMDSVRTGFNKKYAQWFATLAYYFSHVEGAHHTDFAQYGSLDVQPWTMAHEQAVEIIKHRIGWLLFNADELQVDVPQS